MRSLSSAVGRYCKPDVYDLRVMTLRLPGINYEECIRRCVIRDYRLTDVFGKIRPRNPDLTAGNNKPRSSD